VKYRTSDLDLLVHVHELHGHLLKITIFSSESVWVNKKDHNFITTLIIILSFVFVLLFFTDVFHQIVCQHGYFSILRLLYEDKRGWALYGT
jgi:hypothetical protein